MTRAWLIGLILAFSALPAEAEYRWEQQLYGNDVRDLTFGDGSLWWATHSGLVRMELADTTLTVFRRSDRGLPSDSLNAVVFDGGGNLWCGTDSEGIAIRLAAGGWRFVRTLDGLPDRRVLSLAARGSEMTVGTAAGFVSFEGLADQVTDACTVIDPCVNAMPSLTVQAISVEPDTTWFGTAAGPVQYVRGDDNEPFRTVFTGLGSIVVRAVTRYQGETWIGTDDGAYRFSSADTSWSITAGIPADRSVVDFLITPERFLCVSPSSRRVYEWTGSEWNVFGSGVFLRKQAPQSLALDGDGEIWVGTQRGVRRYDADADEWTPAIAVDGIPAFAPVWNVLVHGPDDAHVAFQTEAAGRWDGEGWTGINATTTGGAFENTWLQGLFRDASGKIWYGHCCCIDDGCYVDRADADDLAGSDWERIPARNVRAIVQDPSGWVFLGAGTDISTAVVGAGLHMWREGFPADSVFVLTDEQSPLLDNTITALTVDPQGRIWIGYRRGQGVHRWDYGTDPTDGIGDSWLHYGPEEVLDSRFIISGEVLSMALEGPRIWVGTTQGVSVIENSAHRGSWGSSSLPNPFISAMTVTTDGSAWAGTPAGVVRFAPNAVGTWDLEQYTFPELSNATINGLSASGRDVWVASDRGLTIGRPVGAPETGPGGQLLGSAYPNPFRPLSHGGLRLTDITTPVSGDVYDASGGLVASFQDVEPGQVVWNGRTSGGVVVAPGIYVVVARSGNLTLTARVAVIR